MKYKKRTGSVEHAIAAVAKRQHGVVSRPQLRGLGLSDRAISGRAASGGLHPLFPGTFAVGHSAIGRRGRMLSAVLACGKGTVLSHGSAAELLGLWNKRAIPIDVISPGRSGRRITDVRWHNVRRPEEDEVEIREGIPCTTVSRTLVDLAGRVAPKTRRRLVEQAAILRLLDVGEVDRVLARGRRRGAPDLRTILAAWRSDQEVPPRLRSPLEARFLPELVKAGLPCPQCNAELQIAGERFEPDLLWEEQRLIVELDGEKTHRTRAAFQRDRRRDQILLAAGYRTARVTWRQVEDEPKTIVARVKRMLEAG